MHSILLGMCVCECVYVYIPIFLCIHVCVHRLATQCLYKFGQIVVVCDRERTNVANDNNYYGQLKLIGVDLTVYVCMHVFAVA